MENEFKPYQFAELKSVFKIRNMKQ